MKRIVSVGIVLFWGIMVTLLVRRTFAPPPPLPSAPSSVLTSSVALTEQEGWMGIYHHNKKIGYFHRRLVPVESGYRWEEQSRMKLRVMETDQLVHTDVR